MNLHSKFARACSRTSCRQSATMTLTYNYADSTAALGPLATFSEPHSYDLCELHGAKLTVPNGWSVIRQTITGDEQGPTDDDLMAIADAVREVAALDQETVAAPATASAQGQVGRRGHLRAVPS